MVKFDEERLPQSVNEERLPHSVNGERLPHSVNGDVHTSSHDGWSESQETGSRESTPQHNLLVFAFSLNGIALGFLTTLAGLFQILAFPMLCAGGAWSISLDLSFFYGFAVWSGIALILTSTTGYRTTATKRQSTVNRYLAMMILTSIIYTLAVAFVVTAFAKGSLHELDACMVAGHVVAAAFVCLGACLQVTMMVLGCFTIFRQKPLQLFTYCTAGCMDHCCPHLQLRDYSHLNGH